MELEEIDAVQDALASFRPRLAVPSPAEGGNE